MNILFVTPPPYLPNRLHRMRSFDLIRLLSQKHDVHMLCVTTKDNYAKEFLEIKKLCKSVTIIKLNPLNAIINCLRFFYLPSEVGYCYSPFVKNKIEELVAVNKINLVYIKRLRGAINIPRLSQPVIIDTTDAMSMFYTRMFEQSTSIIKKSFYFLEAMRYKRFEEKCLNNYPNWITCSLIDKNYLQNLNSKARIFVIPNIVDTTYFSESINQKKNTLLFRGLMDKPVNIDAAEYFIKQIFPIIKTKVSSLCLYIVGPRPHRNIKKLAQPGIIITGFVKDDREYLEKSEVVVCPIRIASGTRFKILQAWAMGKPVVSTTIGAEGLEYKAGKNILIADQPKDFADQVVKLLTNKKLYAKLAKNGRKTSEKYYGLDIVGKKLLQVINYVSEQKV